MAILRKASLTLLLGYVVLVAVVLLREVLPLVCGGDNLELAVKSVLLVAVAGYAALQWLSVASTKSRWLWSGLLLNALFLLPVGVAAVLGRHFGGEKIMSREGAILGVATVMSAGTAAVHPIALVVSRRAHDQAIQPTGNSRANRTPNGD